jgi:xylulose-5-phosphate/fructose-6-phosphate phosphoketolase
LLASWLSSYKPSELFDDGSPRAEILKLIPEAEEKRLGRRKEANADYFKLDLPEWEKSAVKKHTQQSCMEIVGDFLAKVIVKYVQTLELAT